MNQKTKKVVKNGNKFEFNENGELIKVTYKNGYWERFEFINNKIEVIETSEDKNERI